MVRLAEELAIPVSETGRADRMNFPASHWAHGTGPAVRDADVLLVLEATIPFIPGVGGPKPSAKIVWSCVDPVLSRFKTMEYRADMWLPTPVAPLVRAIREAVLPMLDDGRRRLIAERRERMVERKRQMIASAQERAAAEIGKGRLTGRVLAYEIGRLLEPDSILLNDALSNGGLVRDYASRDQARSYYRSGSSAGGWGSGAAVGVKLAAPDRDVVHATGDGYFMFGSPLAALWAAQHHNAPYLAIVFVNGSYSTGTTNLDETYPDGYAVSSGNYDGGTFRPPPNFAKLAEAANCHGEEVDSVTGLGPALRRGLAEVRDGTPAVVAVHLDESA